MDLSVKEWIEIVGVIVLPVVGFIFTFILSGLRGALVELKKMDTVLDGKITDAQRENAKWQAEIPEKYARRDDLQRAFQQLNDSIQRADEKLERLLTRALQP
jgi:chromosome segregation ATPase